MTYQINAILVILSDLPGHSPTYLLTACLSRCFFFVQLCSSWQDFDWHSVWKWPAHHKKSSAPLS